MGGRDRVDPELARVVEQRLEDLLAERGPRRRRADPPPRATDDLDELKAADPDELRRDHPASRWPGFTRAHLAVVVVLATLGILLAGWAVLRARPVPLPAVAVPRATPVSSGTPAPGSATPSSVKSASARASPGALVVHVLGAVRRPGLVRLPERARVQDAIDQAGGLRPGADLGDLNLAQLLTDGQQVLIGQAGKRDGTDTGTATGTAGRSEVRSGSTAGSSSSAGTGGPASQLDLNSATAAELEALPGVGPVTADKIIAWRDEHGRFSRVEELQEVAGIGPKTYADIAPYCRV